MKNIRCVIFDVGRVLVHIKPTGEKFSQLMREIGIEPSRAFDIFWLRNEVRKYMTGELSPLEFHQICQKKFNAIVPYQRFVECWCDLFSPIAGMEELFHEVADRYRVGILSDTDPLHWGAIRTMLPWLEQVAKPTLSYEVGYLKPHPIMYKTAAKNSDCAKEECLFIDDMVENVDGARFSGMPALQFDDLEKLRRDLQGLDIL